MNSYKYQLGVTIALLACLPWSLAQAAGDNLNFELTPFAAYRFGGQFYVTDSDASLKLDDSPSYGLLLNIRHQANTQWEVLYSRQRTEARAPGVSPGIGALDVDIQTLQGGGTYQGDGDTVRPYLAATIGGTHIKTVGSGSGSDTFVSFSMGLGLQIRPSSRLGLRLEARGYGTLTSSNTDLFCQTGPDQNICAIRVDGNVMWQLEALAGIVFRF
jgi:opacity protein-like surface antigen